MYTPVLCAAVPVVIDVAAVCSSQSLLLQRVKKSKIKRKGAREREGGEDREAR